ncbi:hypothetical protein [Ruminococcus sp.]|uniref:hypothetical protein n=1 Tax=Ruminococcus sp. TaxID=41978 RepID=UPI00388EBEB3
MSKILIVIGLILTLVVTLPMILFLILFMAANIYRDYRERPDAPPPSKDEWRLM